MQSAVPYIGHWARECRAPEDQRGRGAGGSSKASTSPAPTMASGVQQSWYVASDASGILPENLLSFSLECRGHDTLNA